MSHGRPAASTIHRKAVAGGGRSDAFESPSQGDATSVTIAAARAALHNRQMQRILFDFASPDGLLGWSAIDDAVMGGASASRLRHDPRGHAVFEGTVSRRNNAGFASVRCTPRALGAAGAAGYCMRVRGDGMRYKLNLRIDDDFDGVSYQAAFIAPAGPWRDVRLPLAAFRAKFRGREVAGMGPLDPARVRQAGLMIGDGQAGAFMLEIGFIACA